jgi:hypothetical protein
MKNKTVKMELTPDEVKHIKKLEEQNKKLIDICKFLLQSFTPNRFVRVMMTREQYDDIEYVIANIEGEEE